jgi:4-amino-4-deoxy-L-arabinose transferase-like glycosyltransferase
MFRIVDHRCGHYALLSVTAVALIFPMLGAPSLWDLDEGNNAEAAREMLDCGNWVVPTFNYQLRVDKPALLYWLQIGAFRLFDINEFAARLPSALAALAAVAMTYELGRQLFGPATGFLAGLVLASTTLFCASAHFANPDALLNAFTILTLLCFWRSFALQGRAWSAMGGISAGFAVLAKGPVGLVLPVGVMALFLMSSRKLRLLWERRVLAAAAAFFLIALPWYIWVGAETKIAFLRGFIMEHNVGRYLHSMEHHGGPAYYYLVVLAIGFAPWSAFLGLAAWYGTARRAREDSLERFTAGCSGGHQPEAPAKGLQNPSLTLQAGVRRYTQSQSPPGGASGCAATASYRFLWVWIAVYFLFFSLAGTKLPNYILPLYTPLAILTARFFDRWWHGAIEPPAWALRGSVASLALVGIGTSAALLVAGGAFPVPAQHNRPLSGLAVWAVLGALPVFGAATAWWLLRGRQHGAVIVSITGSCILFVGGLFALGSPAVDAHKAPRALIQAAQAQHTDREIRVGCYQYFQPSLVFYCRREVQRFQNEEQVLEFLRCPLPVYLFLPATTWDTLRERVSGPHHLLARHEDLYRRHDVVVVMNR